MQKIFFKKNADENRTIPYFQGLYPRRQYHFYTFNYLKIMNLGNLNLGNVMEQMKKIQEDVARTQEDLALKTVSAEAGAGMVSVVVNGALELVSVKIDPALLKPEEAQTVQDLIIAAVKKGMDEARLLSESELKKISGLFPNLPGMDFLK
jgi:nucleoid-associated protein EbfC